MPARGPDPAEFDAEFVVGGDDDESGGPSRTGTPAAQETSEQSGHASVAADSTTTTQLGDAEGGDGSSGHARAKSSVASVASVPSSTMSLSELPTEARVKLRRLDKLEGKYQGMWRYRHRPIAERHYCLVN